MSQNFFQHLDFRSIKKYYSTVKTNLINIKKSFTLINVIFYIKKIVMIGFVFCIAWNRFSNSQTIWECKKISGSYFLWNILWMSQAVFLLWFSASPLVSICHWKFYDLFKENLEIFYWEILVILKSFKGLN